MSIPDAIFVVALVLITAFLFGVAEYRHRRPPVFYIFGLHTAQEKRRAAEREARTRAVTRALEVLAWAFAGATAVVLVFVVAGVLL